MGHVNGPLDFTPLRFCSWSHRFDDPLHDSPRLPFYRTLYCAEHRITCFREILDPFAPNLKTAREMSELYGVPLYQVVKEEMGKVPMHFLLDKAVAPARIRMLSGELVPLDDPGVRRRLEIQHHPLLEENGMERLDVSAARSRRRIVTQMIGRTLYEEGAAGVAYGSNVDSLRCFALFELRAELEPLAEPEPLGGFLDEIQPVFDELGLVLSFSS